MNKELTFFELTQKLNDGELELGQRFIADYGSELYVGTQEKDNYGHSDNMTLKWSTGVDANEIVGITQVTTNATYSLVEKYEVITIEEMFELLLNGKNVYYNVREFGAEQFPTKYFHVKNILTLKESNVFNELTLTKDVRFYKKLF